jgi:hypothetical protein
MLAKVKKPAPAAKPTVADLAKKGDAIADAARVAALKAELETLGFSVRERKDRQNINDEMVAALTAVVVEFGGVDDPSTKASFIKARKSLWPISNEQRARNKAAAERRRKQKEAAKAE